MAKPCPHDGGTTSQVIGESKYIKCAKCGDVLSVEDAPHSTKSGKRPR